MGKSILCNFEAQIEKTNGNQIRTGANTLKEAKKWTKARNEEYTGRVFLWPQTAYGRKIVRNADYMVLNPDGSKEYKSVLD